MSDDQTDDCDTVAHSSLETVASSPRDPRAVKSGLALEAALLTLLERKPFDQVTVREIATAAGVHYATFFRHHPTKEALLDRVAARQIDRLVELTLPVLDRVDSRAAVTALFAYVDANRALWTTLLTGGAAPAMREELLRIARTLALERAPRDEWIPVELAVNCSVSLIFEVLAWWLAQPHPVPRDRLAMILDRLLSALMG